ncbi:MAG: SCO family protein [Cyclobacteriaceae bacterium]
MKINLLLVTTLLIMILPQCEPVKESLELPILGRDQIVEKEVDGEIVYDTIQHRIADFGFLDQDSTLITNETFAGQVYVADFFFTSCPTICPVMKREMLRVYEAFENEPELAILSHTIDPKHDDVKTLRAFAENLGIKSDKWHFVTGDKDDIFELAETSYYIVANEDLAAPGGIVHSGAFLLIDKKGRIRGVYDGTIPEQVDLLMKDINKLIKKNDAPK